MVFIWCYYSQHIHPHVLSHMAMWTWSMRIMGWTSTMVMPTTSWNLLQNFYKILKKPPTSFFSCFIQGSGTTPLYEVVLDGKEECLTSLEECSQQLVHGKVLPPTLYEQLGNCANNNKYWYEFCFWSLFAQGCTFHNTYEYMWVHNRDRLLIWTFLYYVYICYTNYNL